MMTTSAGSGEPVAPERARCLEELHRKVEGSEVGSNTRGKPRVGNRVPKGAWSVGKAGDLPRCFMTQVLLETVGRGKGNVAGSESFLK